MIKSKFKYLQNILYILFCLGFIIINILFLNNKMPKFIILNFSRNIYNIILIITIFLSIIICVTIYYMYKKNVKLEKLFLVVAIPIGFLFMTLLPVGFVPDEVNHFARSYEISSGVLVSDKSGIEMPVELGAYSITEATQGNYKNILNNIFKKNSSQLRNYTFLNTSLYNFVCYIPQVIGITIGRIFNAPVLLDGYLGRIVNYFCWLMLIYFAIKYIPFAKVHLVILSLLPITMQEAVSLSPDSLTYAISVFFISYVLYLSYIKNKLEKKDYFILPITCIILSLCKIVYLPLCLLLFIIPKEKFKSLKDKNIKIGILTLFVFLINILWLKIASVYLVETNPGVNSALQIKYVLANPINYLKIIIVTIKERYDFYFNSMFGGLLGSFNVNLSYFYPGLSIMVLIFYTILDNFKANILKNKDKIWLLIIFVMIIVLIFTSLYVQWTPLKMNVVDGVQGRYFLPIIILVPILFIFSKKEKLKIDYNYFSLFAVAFSFFANLCALIYIFYVNF